MASRHQFQCLTEELKCPIRLEYFTDPVSLECGHNYCRFCITRSWETLQKFSCPECRQVIANRDIKFNRALANIVEKARELNLASTEMQPKYQCEKHREELKLFCENDKKLICYICRDAREHRGHSFLPIDEAYKTYKVPIPSQGIHSNSTAYFHVKHFYPVCLFQDQVKSSLASLAKRKENALKAEVKQREKISQLKVSYVLADVSVTLFAFCTLCDDSACLCFLCVHSVMPQCLCLLCGHGVMSQCLCLLGVHVRLCDILQEQVKSLETQVTADFAKMHQSLTDREQIVMRDLRQREHEILHRMERNLRGIRSKLDSVKEEISELQTHMEKDGVIFLQVKRLHYKLFQ
uniref:RING-type E3 ubiquitin transferase n=1 Tax=Callorhinchus milii TaxID=7868 RepID=A0A4W3JAB1_CALMI